MRLIGKRAGDSCRGRIQAIAWTESNPKPQEVLRRSRLADSRADNAPRWRRRAPLRPLIGTRQSSMIA